ncbi:MAG: hypothetical protein H6835_17870 [Planctomycetes bacterium]|nr:hypothetical protein [Planctomycetota bacterium]
MKLPATLLTIASLSLVSGATGQALQFASSPSAIALNLASTIGFEFTPNEDIYVTAVGCWDRLANGLAASHELRIWSNNGASLEVSAQVPAGTAARLEGPTQAQGRFRYVEIPQTLLRAGVHYVIGAQTGGGDEHLLTGVTSISTPASITWNNCRQRSGSLAYPSNVIAGYGYIAANFLFRPAFDEPALEIDVSASPQILDFDATRGWLFRAEEDVVLTSVGMWDHNSDGLLTSHDLLVWDSTGTSQLLSAQIPAGTVAPLMGPPAGPGRFRYHAVPPLVLHAGQEYVIGMQVAGDDFLNDGITSITSSDQITWLEGRFTSSGLSFPTYTVGTNTYFGPNFLFERPVQAVGAGCVEGYASYYQQMSPTAMDLSGMELVLNDYGGGFQVFSQPGTILPVGSLATPVHGPMGDDSALVMGALAMEIHSNCQVAFSAGNSTDYVPDANTMLNTNPGTALYAWTDLNPAAANSGQIWYEENGFDYMVTYDGVYQFGTAEAVTVQFRGNRLSNSHVISFGAVHTLGQDWLIGYSPGGPNQDPGPVDYSTLTAAAPYVSREPDTLAPLLEALAPPQMGASVQVRTSNFDPGAVFHIGVLGISDPALPLTFLGLDPACRLHASPDVLMPAAVIYGQSSLTWSPLDLTSATVPGFEFYVQAATLDLSVLSGTTRLSNGLRLRSY